MRSLPNTAGAYRNRKICRIGWESVTSRFEISGRVLEAPSGISVAEAFRSIGMNPSAYVFIIDGRPVPMDSDVADGVLVRAVKVASGG